MLQNMYAWMDMWMTWMVDPGGALWRKARKLSTAPEVSAYDACKAHQLFAGAQLLSRSVPCVFRLAF